MSAESPPTIEERVRLTLREVADRLPAGPGGTGDPLPLPPPVAMEPGRPSRLARPLMAAAAVLVVGLAAVTLTGGDGARGPVRPPAADDVALPLLEAEAPNGIRLELRLVRRGGGLCAVLADDAGLEPPAPEACLADAAFPVQASSAGGGTAVYGLHYGGDPPAADFGWTTEDPSAGHLRQAAFEGGHAFLLVLEDEAATGTVAARDADGTVLATGGFDRGGPSRAPAGSLGATVLDYAFTRGGAIWAVGVDGTEVRLTHGTARRGNGWPSASPDGNVVLFGEDRGVGVFWTPMAVAVADGVIAERRTYATTWSPSGALRAGMVPVDDSGAPTEVAVVDAATDEELFTIELGVNYEVGELEALAWDGDARLLAATRSRNDVEVPRSLWLLDLGARTAVQLVLDADSAGAALVLAERAELPGQFAAIRITADRAEWGQLLVVDGAAVFKRQAVLSPAVGGDSPDLSGRLYLDARRGGGRWLLGDGRALFEVGENGDLRLLRDDVEAASAP